MEGQLGALRRLCFGEVGFVEQLDALDDEEFSMCVQDCLVRLTGAWLPNTCILRAGKPSGAVQGSCLAWPAVLPPAWASFQSPATRHLVDVAGSRPACTPADGVPGMAGLLACALKTGAADEAFTCWGWLLPAGSGA